MIPYGKQDISNSDIKAVTDVLKSPMLTQGPLVPKFEERLASYCGVKYATAVNSATSGLHLACLALGLSKGDILWTSPITFVASANCGIYCGAKVDFVDIDPTTFNISHQSLLEKINHAKSKNQLPKILVLVHMCGLAVELRKIRTLCNKYKIKIVEDASHALGSNYEGGMTGGCHYSDITVFSFHPVKMITTAEGGMVTTNSKTLDRKLKALRTHGIYRPAKMIAKQPWYYEQQDLGFNFRMTDIAAALGLNQMKRIDKFVNIRNRIAERYIKKLKDLPLKFQSQEVASKNSYHLFVIQLDLSKLKKTKYHLDLFKHLRSNGINVNLHYMPVYKHPFYAKMKKFMPMKNAEAYYATSISLPIFTTLTVKEQDKVVSIISNYFSKIKLSN